MNAKEYMEFTDEPSPPALRGLGGLGGKSKPLNKDKVKAPTDPNSGDRGLPKVGLSKKAEPSNPLDNAPAPVFDMSLLSKALQESNKDIVAAIQQLASVVEKSNPDTKYNEHIDDVISNIDDKVLTDDVVIVLSKSKVEEPLGLENKQVKMYNSLREMLDNL